MIVTKIPNWAAAPTNINLGLASKGPKSIIDPIPINKSSGNNSGAAIPELYNVSITPGSPSTLITPVNGILTRIAPNPSGNNTDGSSSFLIAKKIKIQPTMIITTCCHLNAKRPFSKKSIFPP